MTLFWVNSQQAFNIEKIVCVDDYGADVGVTIEGNREYRVSRLSREAFFLVLQQYQRANDQKS